MFFSEVRMAEKKKFEKKRETFFNLYDAEKCAEMFRGVKMITSVKGSVREIFKIILKPNGCFKK